MASINTISSEKKLFIYDMDNLIHLRIAFKEQLDRPIVLAGDYLSGLTSCIYKDTLYYAYINQSHDIIIKCILDTDYLYKVDANELPDCISPTLVILDNILLLFYQIKNPLSDECSLKCIAPFEENVEAFDFPDIFTHITSCEITILGKIILLYVNQQLYFIEKIGHITKAGDNNNLKNTIKQYEEKIKSQSMLIESIKKQYQELYDTATHYKNEAIKWRSKFN